MFEKILIANRGEIACRIIKTCKKLGIATVAVHSDADAEALFVVMADERVSIGPPPATQSYLLIDRIVEACKKTGAQAVHPGYGFLSERAGFAQALADAGIAFIGPPASAIEAMGDKIESKRLARAAGVSTVPGTLDAIADPGEAVRIAGEIGYPVMVKASAGGGGKGMRIAWNEQELVDGLARSRSEAKASFGDDRCFIEKFVEEPRHIEIQVLGDQHGTIIYLGERECSIQRRHQKVIEEAPSPFLDPQTRAAMGEQAVALARDVGYFSAGTVEFIVDRHKNFYFLEMNTRLQVEHPVTELITGIDLVEKMIKIAAGEPVGVAQDDVKLDGWAMEARVYAEEPGRGFLPSTGRVRRYIEPQGEGIRVDTGIVEGGEVTMFYDPMIAKLCSWGESRELATDRLVDALDAFVIEGPGHNIAFLSSLLTHPRFVDGRLTTGFIAEEFGERFDAKEPPDDLVRDLAAIAAVMRHGEASRAARDSDRMPGWQHTPAREWAVAIAGRSVELELEPGASDFEAEVTIGGEAVKLQLHWQIGLPIMRATINGAARIVQVVPIREGYVLKSRGFELSTHVRTLKAASFAARMPAKVPADTSRFVTSPMPGLIVSIAVEVGQTVEAGQELCILEAMKMENVLRAEQSATVAEIRAAAHDTVSADDILIVFE